MAQKSKRFREIAGMVDPGKVYPLGEAIALLKKCPPVKFDQSVELSIKTGVDFRKTDQQVRGTVSLPNGTGRQMVVLVFARGDKVKEALDAGADFAGSDEFIEKVKSGWIDFNAVVAAPDMMREVGKLGKVLGPRGLMPTPKAGTVATDIAKAVREVKAGKVEFKGDKSGVINSLVGKLSFDTSQLEENVLALLQAVVRAKPASARGEYLKNFVLSSTMGPGLKIQMQSMEG